MRKLILSLLALTIAAALHAQSNGPALELTYLYKNTGTGEQRTVTLLVRGHESLTRFFRKDTLKSRPGHGDFDISGEDDAGRQVYKNTTTGEVIFRDFMARDGNFIPCVVADPMKPLNWVFAAESKQIGKYTCKAASTEFRGRKYEVWYAEDIPVTHGPWKLSGLPGAIVEVRTSDQSHSFILTRVATIPHAEIRKPGNAQSVTIAEFVHTREQSVNDFVNRLAAALPRGAEITSVTSGDYNLETDFKDVKK